MSLPPSPTLHRLFVGKDVHKFSCAHMTIFPDGSKERLHGHNFQVSVALELIGETPPFIDFGLIKKALQAQCDAWTERLLLPAQSRHLVLGAQGEADLEFRLCGKRYVVPSDEVLLLPTDNIVVETLASVFARALVERLHPVLRPDTVAALELTVSESAGQGATFRWRNGDLGG